MITHKKLEKIRENIKNQKKYWDLENKWREFLNSKKPLDAKMAALYKEKVNTEKKITEWVNY